MTRLKKFSFFAVVLSVCLPFFFTSCEGFFTNNGLDEKIQAAVDYAHMPTSECQISVDNGTGTITPLGAKQYKPTDYMNIEFVMDPAYEFLSWDFIYKETITKEGEIQKTAADPNWWQEYVKIASQTSSEKDGKTTFYLKVQFTKGTDNLIIKPKCSKKPSVDAWEPGDSTAGVPRETQIRIKFDTELSDTSFFYTAEELEQLDNDGIAPEDLLKDGEKVYGYKTTTTSVFKSIKISVDGGNYTGNFVAPVLETIDAGSKKYTRVTLTPQDVLPCPDDESKTAAVTVDLYDTVQNKDGASLTPTKYTYRINSKPLDYSYVDMSDYNIEEGQPNPGNARFEFAISKHIALSFKENPSYQFLYWTTNNSNIRFADGDPTLNPTSFFSTVLIKESDKAKIKPVTVVRPKFQEADFKAAYAGTKPRDTDIVLNFDKEIVIPEDAKFAITCTGKGDVSTSFEAPVVVNGKKIQILAKQDENRIQVRSGENLTITVTIPDSIYYVYHDILTDQDINVTIGKEIQAEYKIDNTTQDKASVSFSARLNDEACGTINVDNVKKTDETPVSYDIDNEAIINFKPNENFEFLYWTASNDKIEIRDRFSASTTIIAKKSGACTITAKCAPKLKVLSLKPNASDNKNPCDSDIWIETNIRPLALTATGRTSDNKKCNSILSLSVNYNGTDVMSSHYETPEIKEEDGKIYIYLKSKKKLSVPQDTVNSVNVKIDGAFHYAYEDPDGILTDPVEINLVNGNYSGSFGVVEKTQKQIYVQLAVNSAHMNLATAPLDPYRNNSGTYVLNENTEYDLNFTAQPAYQFVKWNITGQDNDAEDAPVKIQKTTMYGVDYYKLVVGSAKEGVGTSTSPITIADDSAERIVPTLTSPEYISAGVERDSGIILSFNKKPDDSIKQKIQITVDGYSVADSFDLANANFAGNTLTINPNTSNRISVSTGTTRKVKVTIPADTYYTYPETTPTDNILCGKDYTFEYTINEQTNDKVKVTYKVLYDNSDTPATGTTPLTIKCNDVAVPSSQEIYFMDGISRTLTIADNDDYQFLYWETNAPTDFVFNPNTAKTSKTIQFTTANPNTAVTVTAYCAPRLKVTGTSEPVKQTAGVQRDSDISLTFNIKPDLSIKDKIRITADGIPANTNFKLADITDSSFTSGNKLTIQADLTKRITVPANSTKTMLVTVPADTYYQYTASDNQVYDITLGNDYTHEYTINETTLAQAKVTYQVCVGSTVNSNAGTIKCDDVSVPASQITYNMDSVYRTLSFVENSDYQFLYWDVSDTNAIAINSTSSKQTTFVPSGNKDNVILKAVCAPRLKLDHATPASSDDGVARDSNITLWFNANPDISLLKSNISIYCGGSSVKDCFPTSGWSNLTTDNGLYKLTINASSSNRISVTTGTKPTVTVTVPAATYYNYTAPDGNSYPVTCGTNNTYEYKINASTKQQANVLFKVYDYNGTTEITGGTAGTITCDGVTPSSTGIKYDMDNIARTLNFTETEDYQFLYWTSTNSIISINSNTKENKTSSFTPVGTGTTSPSSDIIIKAVCAKRPRVTDFSPAYSEDGIEQDTNIQITFDQTPVNYSAINVYRNDVKDTTHFGTRAVANKVLTITTTKVTAATGTDANVRFVSSGTQNVRVEIPAGLYYNCTSNGKTYPVTYGGSGRSDIYKINSSTTNKVTVTAGNPRIYDTTTEISEAGIVTISPDHEDHKYNIGETIIASFEKDSEDYRFSRWTCKSSDTTQSYDTYALTSSGNGSISQPLTYTVSRSCNGTETYSIFTEHRLLTKIESFEPANTTDGVPCDSSIIIKFNKKMSFASLTKGTDIIIYDKYDNNISDYYESPTVTTQNGKTVVTVKIKPDYSIKDIIGYSNTMDIRVKLKYFGWKGADDGISFDTEGYVKEGTTYINIKYRINRETEATPPNFTIKRVGRPNSGNIPKTPLLKEYTALNPFSEDNIINKIMYSFKLTDSESGVDQTKVTINAQKIYDRDGNPDEGPVLSITQQPSLINGCMCGNVDFTSDFDENSFDEICTVKVDFYVYDIAGNTNFLTYYVGIMKLEGLDDWYVYNRYGSNLTNDQIESYASTLHEPVNSFTASWRGSDETQIPVLNGITETYVYCRTPRIKVLTVNGTDYFSNIKTTSYMKYSTTFPVSSSSENTTAYHVFNTDDYNFAVFKINASKTADTYLRIYINTLADFVPYTKYLYIPKSPVVYKAANPYDTNTVFGVSVDFDTPNKKIKTNDIYEGPTNDLILQDTNGNGKYYSLVRFTNITTNKTCLNNYTCTNANCSEYFSETSNANYIFETRFLRANTNDSGYATKFSVDLRSPASDVLNYTTNTMVTPVFATPEVITDAPKKNGLVQVKIKVTNYESLTPGTKIGSNTIDSSGYFTCYLSNNSIQTNFTANCNGYKPVLIEKSYNFSYSSTGVDTYAPYQYQEGSTIYNANADHRAMTCIYLMDGVLADWSIYDPANGIGIDTVEKNGETCFKYKYAIIPDDALYDDSVLTATSNINQVEAYVPAIHSSGTSYGVSYDRYSLFPQLPVVKGCTTHFIISDRAGNNGLWTLDLPYSQPDVADLIPITKATPNKTNIAMQSKYYSKNVEASNKKYYLTTEEFDATHNRWIHNYTIGTNNSLASKYTSNSNLYVDCSGKSEGGTVLYSFSTSSTPKATEGKFYRLRWETSINHSLPVYWYCAGSTNTGNVQNLYEGTNGVTLLCDAPTLYYCCYSYEDYGDDMDKWEEYGGHTSPKMITTSSNADTSDVPNLLNKKTKYVVIAHFANNTTAMSSVMTKK